ncbi:MAG TPA: hypothetical protein VMN56_09060 [Casimicrobiaceae bacterium]|nr:hypothetical protein [Casimicrobiaceae bacterium]
MSSPVGVLLPVRIETAFDPHPGGCRLRMVVMPDVPWIDRHDDTVRSEELDALDAAYLAAAGDFTTDQGRAAFNRLAHAYGGARAAWLARTFPAQAAPDFAVDRAGATIRDTPRPSLIRGLPKAIELWAATPGFVLLTTLTPSGNALSLDFGDGAVGARPGEDAFTPTWDGARAAGLAADIELGDFGVAPGDIEVLYAIGLGDEEPGALFDAHRDAGLLAILAAGTPTNSVAGAPAADLGHDDEAWIATVRAARSDDEEGLLSGTLTGKRDALGPLPAPPRSRADEAPGDTPAALLPHDERAMLLVRTLWPALWQANLKDIWGVDFADEEAALRLGRWAGRYLMPEGPLPPIRIGDQPYGVLPVTSLARWDCAGDTADVEAALVAHLTEARALWAQIARDAGTIAGADSDKVLALLERLPVTLHLTHTAQLPLEVLEVAMSAIVPPAKILDWWRKQAEEARKLRGGEPARAFVQFGSQTDIALPLVEPTKPAGQAQWMNVDGRTLFARALHWFARTFQPHLGRSVFEVMRNETPRSLLFRLIVHSAIVAASEIVRTAKGVRGPADLTEGRLSDRFDAGASPGELPATPAGALFEALWKSLDTLADEDTRVLERTFLAALDTASYRIDPWITGVAWRRLSTEPYFSERRRLGAYGWVDRPYTGTRGPTRAGLLLAPSVTQARTAVILRDKAVYDPAPAAGALPGTRRWDMSIDSARARLAQRICAEVRIGAPLAEVLGREVERIAATKDAIDALRQRYMLHSANQGRRVCDGEQVIARTPAQVSADTGIVLRADQQAALGELRDAVDVYGDLLVADAVFDVVSGRGDTAGAAMEAAAGLDLPPEIDVVRTPRSGDNASTVLLAVLAHQDMLPAAEGMSPVELAEPSYASYVEATFPAADRWTWRREDRVLAADGTFATVTADATLADLGLAVVDLAVLRPEQVAGLVVTQVKGPSVQPSVRTDTSGPVLHARLLRLGATLSGRPALPTQTAVDAHRVDAGEDDAVRDDLYARYAAVHGLASALHATLTGAAPPDAALASALRFGIAPTAPDAFKKAADALGARLDKVPDPALAATAALPADRIARAIGDLVAPGGGLPLFARMRQSQIASTSAGAAAMTVEPREATPLAANAGAGGNRLDRTWLSTVAAIRASAARLESYQFEAALKQWPSLSAWSNWPGNPWQQGVARPSHATDPPLPALVVVYAPAGALGDADPTLAVSLLDAWTETIPSREQTVTAAFGFNAPASRPPQAILVAVPPDDNAPLDTATLLDILSETRELAHARMASQRDLHALAAALPMTTVPSYYSDIAGVELDDWERTAP